MARLTNRIWLAKVKATSTQPSGEVRRIQVRGVSWILPESQRSRRGQAEAWGNLRGGPQAVLIFKSLA